MRAESSVRIVQNPNRFHATASTGLDRGRYELVERDSGQRREEGPLSGRIKVGFDSYIDPESLSLSESQLGVNAMARLV